MSLNETTYAQLILGQVASGAIDNGTDVEPLMINNTFVIEIIRSVYILYHFKNILLYITVEETDSTLAFLEAFWGEFTTVPYMILHGGDPEQYLMDGVLSTPSLCVVYTTGVDDPIMEFAASSLTAIRHFKTLFILEPPASVFDVTSDSFGDFALTVLTTYTWIWRKQFINTVLVTIENSVFTYDPYPTPNLLQKVGQVNSSDYFVDRSKNMRGYVVETPVYFDVPRVFYVETTKRGSAEDPRIISGISGKLFTEYIAYINATLRTTDMTAEKFDFNHILGLVKSEALEITIHSLTAMNEITVGGSYPVGINDWCIMVPYQNKTADSHYITNSLQRATWIACVISLFYVACVLWICTTDRPRDFSGAFLQSVCSLICIVPTALICAPTRRMRFIYFALFLFGFIMSNLYLTRMASFLAASPPQKQIDTVNDVIASKLRVKLLDFEYKKLFGSGKVFPKAFMDQVDIVDRPFLDAHRNSFNTSYAYSIQTDRWMFLNIQQKHLRRPIFHLSKICIGPFYLQFPMRSDSHLSREFKYFIMYSGQYGLFNHWGRAAFADALYMGHVRMFMKEELRMPLTLDFFQAIWMFWWFGLTCSCVAFILEIKWVEVVRFSMYLKSFGAEM